MIALEFDRISSKELSDLFRINATWLSWIVLPSIILYTSIETLFSISVLFWMIELEFDRITSNKPVNLFLINTAWLSCIVLLLSMLYTVDKTLLPISVLFCMIALEFDQIQSYHPPNLFRVNSTRLSWIVLLSLISYTAHETLFSIIVVLFRMIALEFDRIMSNKLGNLFWINATWLSWIVLFSTTLYAPIGRLFSINVLFWMLALELNSIQSKQSPTCFG